MYYIYNKLYVRKATKGQQKGKWGKDTFMTFYMSDWEKFTKI